MPRRRPRWPATSEPKVAPMSVEMASLSAVVVLALVHLAAGATAALPRQWRPRALSAVAEAQAE